jgi:hypothetical protein
MKLKRLIPREIFFISFLLTSALFVICNCREPPEQKPKASVFADKEATGPYTVYVLSEGVYRIEDANDKNPAGIVMGEDGKMVRMNNCPDVYLVAGKNRALFIDLSNKIE